MWRLEWQDWKEDTQRKVDPEKTGWGGCPALLWLRFLELKFLHVPSIILRAPPKLIEQGVTPSPSRKLSTHISPLFLLCWRTVLLSIIITSAKSERLEPKKTGGTASIFSHTVHWLMSGAGHCMSRHRKFPSSRLSCQYRSKTHSSKVHKMSDRRPCCGVKGTPRKLKLLTT